MRTLRYGAYIFLAVVGIILVPGCDSLDPPPAFELVSQRSHLIQMNEGMLTYRARVRAMDGSGLPIAGLTVSWEVIEGESSLHATDLVTDEDGHAGTAWAVEQAGLHRLRVTAEGAPAPAEFTVHASEEMLAEITVFPRRLALDRAGETAAISVEARSLTGDTLELDPSAVSWVAGDTAVVRVSDAGEVTAVGRGSTYLIATAQAAADTVDVGVTQHLAGFDVGPLAERFYIGQRQQIEVMPVDSGGAAIEQHIVLKWSSSNAAIVEVDSIGVIHGAGAGRAVVEMEAEAVIETVEFEVVSFRWRAVETGYGSHSCALAEHGEAYCWGSNRSGRLGIGTFETEGICGPDDYCVPQAVVGGHRFAELSSADASTCGRTQAGAILCWGWNDNNRYGTVHDSDYLNSPTALASPKRFVTFGNGNWQTCGITGEGETYCWGYNGVGQLGTGALTDGGAPVGEPQLVTGGHAFIQLHVRSTGPCALTANGEVYCWGNKDSPLAWIDFENDCEDIGGECAARPIRLDKTGDFVSLSPGGVSMRGLCATRADGSAVCWDRDGPRDFAELELPLRTHAGRDCAITQDGEVHCWTGPPVGTSPLEPHPGWQQPWPGRRPVLEGGERIQSLSVANDSACVINEHGEMYCWGRVRGVPVGQEPRIDQVLCHEVFTTQCFPEPLRVSPPLSP